jgi:hypothetical protein
MARTTHYAQRNVGRVRVSGILRKAYERLVQRDPSLAWSPYGKLDVLPTDPGALLTLATRRDLPIGGVNYGALGIHFKTDPRDVAAVCVLLMEDMPLTKPTLPYGEAMRIFKRVMAKWSDEKPTLVNPHKDTTAYQSSASAPSMAQQEEWKREERRISTARRYVTKARPLTETKKNVHDIPGF